MNEQRETGSMWLDCRFWGKKRLDRKPKGKCEPSHSGGAPVAGGGAWISSKGNGEQEGGDRGASFDRGEHTEKRT